MTNRFTQCILISVFLAVTTAALPACASTCANPCIGSAANGSDSNDRNSFNSDNSDLLFSNITFSNSSGGPYLGTGLDGNTELTAQLFGATFQGCFSSFGACASNSAGLTIANIGNWGGGSNPALEISNTNFGAGGNTDTFTIYLPANTYAFGLDLIDQNSANSGAPLVVHVGSDMNALAPLALPGSIFFGYRSLTPISTISIWPSYSGVQLALDNIELGESAPTPEAATFFLVGTGLFTLGYARRRKRMVELAAA